MRHTIEAQNRLLIEQGKRLAALESGEPYTSHADPPASHERFSPATETPTPDPGEAQEAIESRERQESARTSLWRRILGGG